MSSETATKKHIEEVGRILEYFAMCLEQAGLNHDASKLEKPEKDYLEKMTHKLNNTTYGTDEYFNNLKKSFTDEHYKKNSHHPEYFENGINGMTLVDLMEMFADWCAALKRHSDGSFEQSMSVNKKRFKMSPQLVALFNNTYAQYKDFL